MAFTRIVLLALVLATALSAGHARTAPDALAAEVRFFYADLERAQAFYREHLGLIPVETRDDAVVLEIAPGALLTLATLESGGFAPDTPRTAAIALVTDQLDEWWEALSGRGLSMRTKAFQPKPGSAHDGFVLEDPEGWFLEFERFNSHPENERLMPRLDGLPTRSVDAAAAGLPQGLGFKAAILWLYYENLELAERFVVEMLDLPLVTDQGWAKIHPLTPAAYLGLVDAARGMHSFTEEKAVELVVIDPAVDERVEAMRHRGVPIGPADGVLELRDSGNHRLRWQAPANH
jgi:catechol 2,3-dioxygenase-like lactoylglutathione lyase family enzyme